MNPSQQRTVLTEALQRGPVSISQARYGLGIEYPERRIHDLRVKGMAIATLQSHETLGDGTRRKTSIYILMPPKEAANA